MNVRTDRRRLLACSALSIVWGSILFVLVVVLGRFFHQSDAELVSPFTSTCNDSVCSGLVHVSSTFNAPGWLWLSALALWTAVTLALFRKPFKEWNHGRENTARS